MKRCVFVTAVIAIVLFAVGASAADKTGFIDMREILFKSEAGKAAAAEFKKLVDQKKLNIQELEDELKKLKDQLDKQRLNLTENALKEKELDYQKKYREYKRLIDDANEEMQIKEQEIFQQLVPEILKVVQAIGEKEGYTMIVDINSVNLPYYSKANDITAKVIERYDKESGGKKK